MGDGTVEASEGEVVGEDEDEGDMAWRWSWRMRRRTRGAGGRNEAAKGLEVCERMVAMLEEELGGVRR
jgi:hypothetical protein